MKFQTPFPPFAPVELSWFRNRASAQAGFISQFRRGQHSGLRPFASMQQPADFFCKEFLPGRHRLEAPFFVALRQQLA